MVTLIMLIAVTIIVVSAIRSSTDKLSIAGNFMLRSEAQRVGDFYIDRVISGNISSGCRTEGVDTNDDGVDDYQVEFCPRCLATAESEGTSTNVRIYDSIWELSATVTDPKTGVSVTITRGVSVKAGGACL